MRLLLALLLMLPLCQVAWGAPVTIFVEAGTPTPGVRYNTMADAVATVTAGDTIQVNDNSITNESVTATANTQIFQGRDKTCGWSSTETNALVIPKDIPVTVSKLKITSSSDGNAAVSMTGGASVPIAKFYDCTLMGPYGLRTGSNVTLSSPGDVSVIRSIVIGTSSSGYGMLFASFGNPASIVDSAFSSPGTVLACASFSGWFSIVNCDIYGGIRGLRCGGGATFVGTNCKFSGNTNDLSVAGGASATMFSYTSFGQLTSGAGEGCLYSTGNSYRMTPNSNPWSWVPGPWFPGNFAAVSIAGVTDQPSIIGIPTGSTIGAVPYIPIGLGDDEEYWHDGR